MTVQNQSDNSTGPGSSFSRIDELCDEFEAAWNSGVPRTISSFLMGMEGDERILLLRELLHTELELRKNSGETPSLSKFTTEFPDESTLITRIYNRHFPGLALADEETVLTGDASSEESGPDSDTSLRLGVRSTWLWKSGSDTLAEMRAFARRVVETGLMTEAELQALREDLPEGRLPVTAGELANLLQERNLVTDYQIAVLRGWTTEPLVLGNYIVLDVIGSGGMGTVYKARHRRMDRDVCERILLRRHPRRGVRGEPRRGGQGPALRPGARTPDRLPLSLQITPHTQHPFRRCRTHLRVCPGRDRHGQCVG